MLGPGDPRSTIVAIASAVEPALRGAVRIAGDDALPVLNRLLHHPIDAPLRPSRFQVALNLPPVFSQVPASVMVWPDQRCYAGCPTAEIHTLGCTPLLEAVVAAAVGAGARPARPGEFTLRAFLSGKLDLTQAEAVLGVIDAENREQLDAALEQLAGNVSRPLKAAREALLNLLADVEAGLDFVEEDISFIDESTLLAGLQEIRALVDNARTQMRNRRHSDTTRQVVLRGNPNAGKSSLLNALSSSQVAIVSDQAGTTRDVVWTDLQMQDYAVRLVDTAGIETASDEIMQQAQTLGAGLAERATLVIHCIDLSEQIDVPELCREDDTIIGVATKSDLLSSEHQQLARQFNLLPVSAKTGAGLETLGALVADRLDKLADQMDSGVIGTSLRCADAIEQAWGALSDACHLVQTQAGHELIAAAMRDTLNALGEMTGEVYTDDVLDRVFARFCIGK